MFEPKGYEIERNIFKVLEQNLETEEYYHVEVAIIDYSGELCAEVAEKSLDADVETDAISTAISYLEKKEEITWELEEKTGKIRWINLEVKPEEEDWFLDDSTGNIVNKK